MTACQANGEPWPPEAGFRAVHNMIFDDSNRLPDPWCGHCASYLEPTRPNGGHRAGCWKTIDLYAQLSRDYPVRELLVSVEQPQVVVSLMYGDAG
jgi:hypothetical protein